MASTQIITSGITPYLKAMDGLVQSRHQLAATDRLSPTTRLSASFKLLVLKKRRKEEKKRKKKKKNCEREEGSDHVLQITITAVARVRSKLISFVGCAIPHQLASASYKRVRRAEIDRG
jgi:hypothetical protein